MYTVATSSVSKEMAHDFIILYRFKRQVLLCDDSIGLLATL